MCHCFLQVRYAESSMRNGFGLKLLHKFFNLPFLQLQRETLLKQLDTNEEETHLTIQELDLFQDSDDADYNKFLDNLINRRRAIADSVSASNVVSNVPSSMSNYHIASSNGNTIPTGEIKKSISMPGPIGAGNPIPVKNVDLKSLPKKESPATSTLDNLSNLQKSSPSMVLSSVQNVTPKTEAIKMNESANDTSEKRDSINRPQSLMSKIFGHKKEDETDRLSHIKNLSLNATLTSVEDFVPDDGLLDRSFLEDNQISPQKLQQEVVESER